MALEKAQVRIHNHTVSSLAAAEAALDRQQKEAGTVLLDIGAGTTNLVVFEDGEVQHVAVLPIGGTHITNDLAIGLKTDLDVAEAVKITHARIGEGIPKQADFRIKVGNQEYSFNSEEVTMIAQARVEELLEYVDKELARVHRSHKLPGGVVLAGGTAKLPGLPEVAREKLELAARIGKVRSVSGLVDKVADPTYHTATGLMMLDMLLMPEDSHDQSKQSFKAVNFVEHILRRIRI